MPPRKRQTRLRDHFNESNDQGGGSFPRRTRPARSPVSSEDSADSEGISRIRLSPPLRAASPNSRVSVNTISDDDDDEGHCGRFSSNKLGRPTVSRIGRKGVRPDVKATAVRRKDGQTTLSAGIPKVRSSRARGRISGNHASQTGANADNLVILEAPEASFAPSAMVRSSSPDYLDVIPRGGGRFQPAVVIGPSSSGLSRPSRVRQKPHSVIESSNRTVNKSVSSSHPIVELESFSQDQRSQYTAFTPRSPRQPRPVYVSSDDDDVPLQRPPLSSRKIAKSPKCGPHPSSNTVATRDKSGPLNPSAAPSRGPRWSNRPRPSEKRQKRKQIVDPDDDPSAESEKENFDLDMEEPERFQTKSRLRARKETAYQRKLRKIKAKREGRAESTTDAEEESSETTLYTSDSAPSTGSEDFIVDDGDQRQDGLLPHEFSLDSAQSLEFKFKVVFQYIVLVIIRGHDKVLPLTSDNAAYFGTNLYDWRRIMAGHRDSRVRSQIWRSDFVAALHKYPFFNVNELHPSHEGCDACHMSGRRSKYEVLLEGHPYDAETHEPLLTDSEDERDRQKRRRVALKRKQRRHGSSSEVDSDDESEVDLPRRFRMGNMCKARASVYHDMTHWEDMLFGKIRGYYHNLLRAKNIAFDSDSEASTTDATSDSEGERQRLHEERVRKRIASARRSKLLRQKALPKDPSNVNEVIDWMDQQQGYQKRTFSWLNDLITSSERLEKDKSTAD